MFRSNFIFRFMHPNNVKNRLLRITFVQFNIMKKLRITALIFILIIPFALVGCGKKASIQGTLNNILKNDLNSSTFTYDVTDTETGDKGNLTVNVKKYSPNKEITLLNSTKRTYTFEVMEITQTLKMKNVEYNLQSITRISGNENLYAPLYFARQEKENGKEKLLASGEINKTSTTVTINGKKQPIHKSKKAFFDNTQIHQVIRGVQSFENMVFSFELVTARKQFATYSMTAQTRKDTKSIDIPYNNQKIETYVVDLTKSGKLKTRAQELYYAKNDMTVNGWPVKNPLVKFIEYKGTSDKQVIYELKDIAIS